MRKKEIKGGGERKSNKGKKEERQKEREEQMRKSMTERRGERKKRRRNRKREEEYFFSGGDQKRERRREESLFEVKRQELGLGFSFFLAPRSNNQAKAKAIALRMKALQMKRGKKTVSKPAVEETDAPPKFAFTKHDQ